MTHVSVDSRDVVNDFSGEYAKVPMDDPSSFASNAGGPGPTQSDGDSFLSARIGMARFFTKMRHSDKVDIEKRSVYGSALAVPQLARSAGWPLNLTLLAFRSYLFLVINLFLQGTFLYMIDKSEEVMDKYAGQMKLCDFGAGLARCPDGLGCVGPGGTRYTPSRVYDYDSWVNRNFVRDSLKALFPDMVEKIAEVVDPGEYGQESHMCRFLCCFLFMASLVSELVSISDMARLIAKLPIDPTSWIQCEAAPGSEARLLITGMPMCWKLVNVVFVLLPKLLLWRLTVSAGMNFLLDTEVITDVIINTVALNFILAIDELLFESLTAPETRWLMDALESYQLKDLDDRFYTHAAGQQAVVEEDVAREFWAAGSFSCKIAIPIRLIGVMLLTALFVWEYYYLNCIIGEEGNYISGPLFLPASVNFPLSSFLFPWINPPTIGDTPIWQMPAIPDP